MAEPAHALTLEFLSWVQSRPRTYAEAMEAWRSHCPRHPVWDDALSEGLIQIEGKSVTLTPKGRALLSTP